MRYVVSAARSIRMFVLERASGRRRVFGCVRVGTFLALALVVLPVPTEAQYAVRIRTSPDGHVFVVPDPRDVAHYNSFIHPVTSDGSSPLVHSVNDGCRPGMQCVNVTEVQEGMKAVTAIPMVRGDHGRLASPVISGVVPAGSVAELTAERDRLIKAVAVQADSLNALQHRLVVLGWLLAVCGVGLVLILVLYVIGASGRDVEVGDAYAR